MSTISSNRIIRLHRGDTFKIPFQINIGSGLENEFYDLTENDYIEFYLLEPNQK